NTTTCNTSDFVTCDATGTFTCQTTDSINCGADTTVIFIRKEQPFLNITALNFEASSGTIDWKNGFNLSADNSAVSTANLKFQLVDSTGSTVFVGGVSCQSTE